jgi:hypothetical protein
MSRIAPLRLLTLLLVIWPAATVQAGAALADDSPMCDPPAYAGVWHCMQSVGDSLVSVVIVDLSDPNVHIGMALPGRMEGSVFVECNSVNPSIRDPNSNCIGDRYPLERIPSMLKRYLRRRAVAAVNTDYFGFPDASHGAEGLAIKNGVRLDGPLHNPGSGIPFIRSYLAVSPENQVTFGKLIYGAGRFDLAGEFYNSVSGGPMLVENGQVLPDREACLAEQLTPEVCTREYQTVAGLTAAGDALVLAVGRHTTGSQLAALLVEQYGVTTAIKFDGGGSAQMAWLDGEGQVRGFDAEIEVDDGFRYVAQGLLVFSAPVMEATGEPLSGREIVRLLGEGESLETPAGGLLCWPAQCAE